MHTPKLYMLIIALFCATPLSAQYKLDIVYNNYDRKLISYEPFNVPKNQQGDILTGTALSGTFRIPIKIDSEGNVVSPEKKTPKTFEDFISDQITNFKFTPGRPTEDIVTINFTFTGDKIENIEFPTTPNRENLVYILYFTIFENTPVSPERQAIAVNATKAILKAYRQPNALTYERNNKQDIYNFINNGSLFPFEYLLQKDSQELLEELINSNSNPVTRPNIEVLYKIQRQLLYTYNSRVLKLALQDIDDSGYNWCGAVSNKVWGKNPRSLITPKHKQSWESLIEFVTKTLQNNPETVIVGEVQKYFRKRYLSDDDRRYANVRFGDWERWIRMSLENDFEKEFIEKFEKYKIVGYPNDSIEEVSELFGCAMLRASLSAFKNSQTIIEPYILRFTEDWDKFDLTIRQECDAVYRSIKQGRYGGNSNYGAGKVFYSDFLTTVFENKKIKTLFTKKDIEIFIKFKVSEDGSITNIDITTPPILTPKEAILCRGEITKALLSLPKGTPVYRDHEPVPEDVNLTIQTEKGRLVPQVTPQVSSGNQEVQGTTGRGFNLAGRFLVGSLPVPTYRSIKSGRVIVDITVDNKGNVINAVLHVQGSTTNDSELIRAACEAAKQARFNMLAEDVLQTGTITYDFILR